MGGFATLKTKRKEQPRLHQYLIATFLLLLGTGGAAVNFVSAYYDPQWTTYHGRSKIPMSVRGKIEAGRYCTYWTLMLVLMAAWAPLFYLSIPGFFYMLWRCGRAYGEDKRAFEAVKAEMAKPETKTQYAAWKRGQSSFHYRHRPGPHVSIEVLSCDPQYV